MMIKRIFCDVLLFVSLFFGPWYLTAGLAIIFMILFRRFWEGIAAAVFLDSIHSVSTNTLYGHFGIFIIIFLILFLLLEYIKPKTRFFNYEV